MPKVLVHDIHPQVDGEYPLVTVDDWSYDEWHRIKKLTGLKVSDFIRANDDEEADADVLLALATISCERAGKQNPEKLLRNGKLGQIEVIPDEEPAEDEASPPEEPSTGEKSNDDTASDGLNTTLRSVSPVDDLPHTGTQG